MRAYEIRGADGIDALTAVERPDPEPGAGEVLVRVRASALNYRDLSVVLDPVARGFALPLVPNSDGAGEVVAVGSAVARFRPGDRVAGLFFQGWFAGEIDAAAMTRTLGGPLDGMLCEYRVLPEDGLIGLPPHLTFEEGATLPVAALTAWHALVEKGRVKAGDRVLLLGTGGVSIFALQFAKLQGAHVTITSGSEEKLARARALGADATVNYRETPEWGARVREMTGGRGVDHVLEVGGAGTFEQSVAATRVGGRVSLIGILTGTKGLANPLDVTRKSLVVQGIYDGSRAMFEAMNRAIAAHGLRPVVDRTFPFEAARDAFHAMRAAGHFGKLVVVL
jgi:NADPH:quinone reductase-like Zn-dependent oxidoreductase